MSHAILSEHFHGPNLDPSLEWHCPPAQWSIRGARLLIQPDAATDFWQRTHYGFTVDNGHFLHVRAAGDFRMTTRVHFAPVHQYDQAGLMVRCSPDAWIKASVEFEPGGPNRLGAVITRNGYSDWSTQDFPAQRNAIALRLLVKGQDVIVEYAEDAGPAASTAGTRWIQIRMGHLPLPPGQPVQAGLYACSPKGAGFKAEFEFLDIHPV